MDAIEQAIRNAFAKGDPADPAFRERVYRWAYSVVDKAIASKPDLSAEDADRQRRRAIAAIEKVETEFQPAEPAAPAAPPVVPPVAAPSVAVPAPVAPPPTVAPPTVAPPSPAPSSYAPEVRVEPVAQRDPRVAAPDVTVGDIRAVDPAHQEPTFPTVAPEPAASSAASPEWPHAAVLDNAPDGARLAGDPEPGRRARRSAPAADERRRRFPWGLLMGLLIVAVAVVLAIWTAAELGFIRPQSSPPPTPQNVPAGAPRAGADAGLEDWIVVFSPGDPTSVRAPEGAAAEMIGTGDGQAMRITSSSGGDAVLFDIGQGVLERLEGRHAVFDIVARTGEGPESQMSVTCNLGDLGECGRNRYTVGKQPAEYLFEVNVPKGAVQAGASIAIASDVDNGGKSVEIVEIRVTATGED